MPEELDVNLAEQDVTVVTSVRTSQSALCLLEIIGEMVARQRGPIYKRRVRWDYYKLSRNELLTEAILIFVKVWFDKLKEQDPEKHTFYSNGFSEKFLNRLDEAFQKSLPND